MSGASARTATRARPDPWCRSSAAARGASRSRPRPCEPAPRSWSTPAVRSAIAPHPPATTTSFAEVARARLIVLAVPSEVAREVLRLLGDHVDGSHLIVHGIRGLGSGGALETVSDIIREETPVRRIGALGGPVQATELTHKRPSTMVVRLAAFLR